MDPARSEGPTSVKIIPGQMDIEFVKIASIYGRHRNPVCISIQALLEHSLPAKGGVKVG